VIRLATTTIARCIVTGRYPSYRWEVAIEPHVLGSKEDRSNLLSGLKFLEERHPGEKWDAAEINGLMFHHCTSRWESAEAIGAIRAHEDHEDGKLSDAGLCEVLASKEAAENYLKAKGTEIYEDKDGTVVTFDGLIDGRPRPEEP
jgi:hypothetical protein